MRTVLIIIYLLVLAAGFNALTRRLHQLQPASAQFERQLRGDIAPLVRLDPRLLNVVTLGFRGLYDDIATIATLPLLVDPQLNNKTSPAQVAAALKIITRHQPRLESLYMLSCFVLSFDLKAPELCEDLSLDGMRALPESWRIPVTQGFVSATKLQDHYKAAIYYGLAASRPGAPAFLTRLTQNLVTDQQLSAEVLAETLAQSLGAKEGSRLRQVLSPRRPSP